LLECSRSLASRVLCFNRVRKGLDQLVAFVEARAARLLRLRLCDPER